ncbi:hypothetical protein fsci_15470 [Francisella sciaenopsi]|uniref:Uncharacterized protein n=1 Tax=Francisella sciaenopsi TaxID=3055034 RepID=A0ABQ6PGI7_9GAMM
MLDNETLSPTIVNNFRGNFLRNFFNVKFAKIDPTMVKAKYSMYKVYPVS